MATTDENVTAPRRSNRARRQAVTYYDEAAKVVEAKRKMEKEDVSSDDDDDEEDYGEDIVSLGSDNDVKMTKKPPKKKSRVSNDELMEEDEEGSGDDGDNDDDDDDDFLHSQANKGKRSSPKKAASSKRAKASAPKPKRTEAKKRPSVTSGKMTSKGATATNAGKITKARISGALNALAKKVLDKEKETPETCLLAALLASSKPIPGIPSTEQPKLFPSCFKSNDGSVASRIASLTKTMTIPQLDGIARQLVRNFEPNAMHILLLNLMFRSVGGSLETNFPEGTDLEEVEDEKWDEMMSKVVTAMLDETSVDRTILCADHPPPPPHDQQPKISVIAYRAIYKEFWYRLGHVLLAHSPSTTANANSLIQEESDDDELDQESDNESLDSLDFDRDDDDDEKEGNEKKKKKKESKVTKKKNTGAATSPEIFSSNRFQLEMMRDLISRVTEFVTVGQPDLRSSGTLAIFQLGKACMERTVELETKIQVASRQFKSAKQNQAKSKMEQLKINIDAWKRHKAELEEIVTGQVIQAVFINRYRDANATLRKESLDSLSEISLIRPDIFLVDTYLKYFGWMTHDKDPIVRKAALNALLAPFRIYQEQVKGPTTLKQSGNSSPFQIEIEAMKHVSIKFLARLVDCTHDANNIGVQEVAMKLLSQMMRVGFLDDCDEDEIWDSINMKCLDQHTSPQVRKDALYFVLDQLAAFDSEDELNEKKLIERLASLAGWIANILSDGTIPVDQIHIHLVDNVVEALLDMPEHRDIIGNMTIMVQAIREANPQNDDKEEITKQRVMLRMLVTAARIALEKGGFSNETDVPSKKGKSSNRDENYLASLSSSLLQNLPNLLMNYKSDVVALRDVTKLPSIIPSSILGLSGRKTDFQNILKSLCQLYLDSTDKETLQNVAFTLSQWVEGDHTRVSDVKMHMKRLSHGLVDRLMNLFRESDPESAEGNRKSPRSKKKMGAKKEVDMFSASPEVETECAIASLMLRLKILLMECQASHLFEGSLEEDEENELDGLFMTISEAMGQRLKDRKNTADEGQNETVAATSSIWTEADPDLHIEAARSIDLSLHVLLLIISQELADTLDGRQDLQKRVEDDDDIDTNALLVVRHRNNLVKLLIMCFEQYIEDGAACTDDQHAFSQKVQSSAGQVTSDLRSLFPYEAAEAADPVRRAMSLHEAPDQSVLLGGFARWFQNQECSPNLSDDEDNSVENHLLPLCRSIAVNMKEFFRREMALALTHIHGRGTLSTQTVCALIRLIRKENPVRLLESHMACLRMAFDNWLASEPEEPQISCPTEEELAAFDQEEKQHQELFSDIEHLAGKLAPTLGVVKLKDDIKRSFVSFMKEGVRFSFEEDDVYTLGVRLPFLSILMKYSSWLKKEKEDLEEVKEYLQSKESMLRSHSDFNEIHDDDLEALTSFKESLGIKTASESSYYDDETTIATRTTAATPSPSSSRRRSSTVGSRRSVQSNLSNLSPLEEGDSREEEDSPTPQKKRRLHSSQNSLQSSVTRTVVEEEQGDDGNESETTA
ncbi:hypothetical protein IV203_001726 [Nitzschia inconspicua]|uniref:SCD domain-containing protein n=1 Tax=Nitzschia inconspicua TaxID=303405 RepID=A0A9K3L7V2_9STRA|nr:hypothetical protein IV203_001726 [Nitzschia inconspicua]